MKHHLEVLTAASWEKTRKGEILEVDIEYIYELFDEKYLKKHLDVSGNEIKRIKRISLCGSNGNHSCVF